MQLMGSGPIQTEELMRKAPAVFSNTHKDTLSKRYSFVNTSSMMDMIGEFGWHPTDVQQQRTRKEDSVPYAKHLLAFEHPGITLDDKHRLRLLLINSHNGLASLKFMIGIFRLVCSNGLIVSDTSFGSFRQVHKNINIDDVRVVLNEMLQRIPSVADVYNKATHVLLSKERKWDFARDAAQIAWPQRNHIPLELRESMLVPRRAEDAKDDLWSVYNTVQESIIKGGITLDTKLKDDVYVPVRSRKVTSLNRGIKVNTGLWDLVNEYAK